MTPARIAEFNDGRPAADTINSGDAARWFLEMANLATFGDAAAPTS
jgi:hypothetical protein